MQPTKLKKEKLGRVIKGKVDGWGWPPAYAPSPYPPFNGGDGEITPFFKLTNMAAFTGTGVFQNSSTDPKTVIDYQGNIINTEPGEMVIDGARRVDHADGMDYGFNALGIQYLDTDPNGVKLTNPVPRLRNLPDLNNRFLNSFAPVTQTIATAELPDNTYTCIVVGAGTVTLSGGATGVVSSGSPFTFTNVGGVTFTISGGTPDCVNVLDGTHTYPVAIPTTTAAVTQDSDNINITSVGNVQQSKVIILARTVPHAIDNFQGIVGTNTSRAGWVYHNGASSISSYDGTTVASVNCLYVYDDDVLHALCYDVIEAKMLLMSSLNGEVFTESGEAAYDGAFDDIGKISLGIQSGYRHYQSIQQYHEGLQNMTLDEMKQWVIDNAHRVTDISVPVGDENGYSLGDENGDTIIS